MTQIRNIVFDLGNVILRYDPEAMLLQYTNDPDEINECIRTVFMSPEWRACDRGDGFREEVLPPCMEKLPPKLRAWCEEICYRQDLELSYPPIDGMEELIAELKENGYGIYLLSNVAKTFPILRDARSVFNYFDGTFASSDFHMLKPDPEIFETFFRHFGLVPDECIFIDDTRANCEGSEKAGMKAVCFNGGRQSADELRGLLAERGIRIKHN